MTECHSCGQKEIPDDAIFCPQCGSQVAFDKDKIKRVENELVHRLHSASEKTTEHNTKDDLMRGLQELMGWK